MTINTIDTTTPLVGLKAGAEVYNANFTDANNAASKEVGTLPDNVPTNADLPTFGTAAGKDTGTASGQIPLNSDLPVFGTAATKNTGTASGEIPLNSDLGTASTKDVQSSPSDSTAGAVLNNETTHIGGEINYTSGNLNPNIFGGVSSGASLCQGFIAGNGTEAIFLLPVSLKTQATTLNTTGSFSVLNNNLQAKISGVTSIAISSRSSNKTAHISITGISGMASGDVAVLYSDTASSKIEVA